MANRARSAGTQTVNSYLLKKRLKAQILADNENSLEPRLKRTIGTQSERSYLQSISQRKQAKPSHSVRTVPRTKNVKPYSGSLVCPLDEIDVYSLDAAQPVQPALNKSEIFSNQTSGRESSTSVFPSLTAVRRSIAGRFGKSMEAYAFFAQNVEPAYTVDGKLIIPKPGKTPICGRKWETVCVLYVSTNIVVYVVGGLFMTVGIQSLINAVHLLRWMKWDLIPDGYQAFNGVNMMRPVSSVILSMGVILVPLALLGTNSILMRKKTWVAKYEYFLTVSLLLIVTIMGLFIVSSRSLISLLQKGMVESIREEFDGNPNSTNLITRAWNFIHQALDCCGPAGHQDFKGSPWYKNRIGNDTVPVTCCRMVNKKFFMETHIIDLFDERCPIGEPGKHRDYTDTSCTDSVSHKLKTSIVPLMLMFFFFVIALTAAILSARSMVGRLEEESDEIFTKVKELRQDIFEDMYTKHRSGRFGTAV
jgi:hypothetical protein